MARGRRAAMARPRAVSAAASALAVCSMPGAVAQGSGASGVIADASARLVQAISTSPCSMLEEQAEEVVSKKMGSTSAVTAFDGLFDADGLRRLYRTVRRLAETKLTVSERAGSDRWPANPPQAQNKNEFFWYDLSAPRNVVERMIREQIMPSLPSTAGVTGVSWWFRLKSVSHNVVHAFHTDSDRSEPAAEGSSASSASGISPLYSAVAYVGGSPKVGCTIVVEPDATSAQTEAEGRAWLIPSLPNRLLVFPGQLSHGVLSNCSRCARQPDRLTLVANFWKDDRRPAFVLDVPDELGREFRELDGSDSVVSGAGRRPAPILHAPTYALQRVLDAISRDEL